MSRSAWLLVAFWPAVLLAVGAALVLTRTARAAPPPGGIGAECVVRYEDGDCLVYRFRDGPRVCYWQARVVYGGRSTSMACVVSP